MRDSGGPALPLLLVAAMVVIGAGIESVSYGSWTWEPELPLLALLVLAFARGGQKPPAEPPARP